MGRMTRDSMLRKIGSFLIVFGRGLMRYGLRVKFYETTRNEIKELTDNLTCIFWDGKFRYTDLETWKKIIDTDWANWMIYRKEFYDCDNFAMSFKARMAEVWGINGVAIALGWVYDAKSGEEVGYHAFNVIIVQEEGNPVLYIYEPQNDGLAKWKGETVIGKWKYKVHMMIWG